MPSFGASWSPNATPNRSTTSSKVASAPQASSEVTPCSAIPHGHDGVEEREIGAHVERDAVERPATSSSPFGPHADGRYLAWRLALDADPDTRIALEATDASERFVVEEGPHGLEDRLFETRHVTHDRLRILLDADVCVGHDLARCVEGHVAAPVRDHQLSADRGRLFEDMALISVSPQGDRGGVLEDQHVVVV